MEIIKMTWVDFDGSNTEALKSNKDGQMTVSELIELLEEAKRMWGDREVVFHEQNTDIIGGFDTVYLHRGSDEREYGKEYCVEDTICIYG